MSQRKIELRKELRHIGDLILDMEKQIQQAEESKVSLANYKRQERELWEELQKEE